MEDVETVDFNKLYISSSDTLGGKFIDQRLESGWNDRPPLFVTRTDDDKLLKGMIRQGIPPILRCAVWTSSVVKSCQPYQPQQFAEHYRTIGKVRQLDYAWDAVVKQTFPDESDFESMLPNSFGNLDYMNYQPPVKGQGMQTLMNVLCAIEHVLGLEYAPLIPPIACLFLRFMPTSYAFCSIREMAHNSSWYFPISQVEHRAWCCAFRDVLGKLHPHTAATMDGNGSSSPEGLDPIFRHFFLPILPYENVLRIMDIYTYEGYKILFRFGVALLCLFKKKLKVNGLEPLGFELWF